MSHHFSLAEVLAAIPDLTEAQIDRHIRAGVIAPVRSEHGPLFREIDIARLRLIADLAEDFALDEEALGLVLSLVDQLHGLRGDMRAMLTALSQEPVETRARLGRVIREVRIVLHS